MFFYIKNDIILDGYVYTFEGENYVRKKLA